MVKFLKDLAGVTKDSLEVGARVGTDWLTGPFKTDELLAKLEETRDELFVVNESLSAQEVERDTAIMDLKIMGAKAAVLNSLATEVAVFAPLAPTPEELDHIERTQKIYDPLEIAYLVTGGLYLVSLLPKLGAGAIKMITLGKFLKDAQNTRFLLGAAKVGKATAVLTVVIFLVETIIKMIHAKKLNEEIEASRVKLREEIQKAERAVALVTQERMETEALRKQMLDDAGVKTTKNFLAAMNDAIADVAADVALVKVARNLLRIGQSQDTVLRMIQLEPEVVERVARRLKIEEMLIAGDCNDMIATNSGAAPREIGLVSRLLTVRGDAARGYSDAELVERHAVTDAVAEMQIELATTELAKHWESLVKEPHLNNIAQDTLIPEAALQLMVAEVSARGQLWEGIPLEIVLEKNPLVARNRLQAMRKGLDADKAFAAATVMSQIEIAVHLRLPLSAVAAV